MKVIISRKAEKQLSKLNPFVNKKIFKILKKFESGERVDIKKMKSKSNEFRVRTGVYRILVKKFDNDDYLVTEVGKRENIYFFGVSV